MGLFSIFSSRKNAEGQRTRGAAAGSAADVARDAVRGSRASSNARSRASRRSDDDDDGLDPELPQKQRARRRLIGAVVLVGAAVIVLPLVFDSKPRPVTDAVAVQIQDQPVDRGAKASTDEPKVASRRSASRPAASSTDQAQALDQGEEVVASNDAPPAAQNPPAAAKPATPPKPVASPTPPAESKPAAKPAQPAAQPPQQAAAPSTDANGGKFILLIGAFASEDRARNWLGKLKGEKIPGYIEHKKVPEKGDLALLRAGPFNDRASAEAAQKRAEQIGLTPKLVQQ
ncbi:MULTISPECIES: SPOR domain-containing protein [Ralstonia]|uniref:SPOR domain-containing protein n=1 Tax=Ralstonia wenshanensis TaxID=2842456 RepID=UPI0021B34099|nr:SPOR domain-containing protein [Ralstonia wenshanensis]MCT7306326.1 SPOR domain-containing protein [Ralstonia wenshanensis]